MALIDVPRILALKGLIGEGDFDVVTGWNIGFEVQHGSCGDRVLLVVGQLAGLQDLLLQDCIAQNLELIHKTSSMLAAIMPYSRELQHHCPARLKTGLGMDGAIWHRSTVENGPLEVGTAQFGIG